MTSTNERKPDTVNAAAAATTNETKRPRRKVGKRRLQKPRPNPFEQPTFADGHSWGEENLLQAVRTGKWPQDVFNDPDYIADALSEKDGGMTPAKLARDHRLYIEAEERVFKALEAIVAGRAHLAAIADTDTQEQRPHRVRVKQQTPGKRRSRAVRAA
jgi:hypothetical protein